MCILCSQPDAPGDGTADWPVARQQIYCFGGFTNTPADPASPDVISAKHAAGYGSVYLVGSVFFICVSASELQEKYSHCGKTKESYLNLSLLIFLSASSFFFFKPCCKFPSLLQGSLVEIFNRGYETDCASCDLIHEHEAVWKSLRDVKWKIMKQVFFTPETQNLSSVGFQTFPFFWKIFTLLHLLLLLCFAQITSSRHLYTHLPLSSKPAIQLPYSHPLLLSQQSRLLPSVFISLALSVFLFLPPPPCTAP